MHFSLTRRRNKLILLATQHGRPKCVSLSIEPSNPRLILILFKLCLAFVSTLTVLPPKACATENASSRYVDFCMPNNAIFAGNGKTIELMREQWQLFCRVYVLNPKKLVDLACDDKAVLTQIANHAGGVESFSEGDKARTPMRAPPEFLRLIDDVATATFNHNGAGL